MSTWRRNIRDDVDEALENGLIDKDTLLNAMLQFMSLDDIKDMLHANEISLCMESDEEDEDERECPRCGASDNIMSNGDMDYCSEQCGYIK